MTRRSTKKQLVLSAISLLLCVSMLVGSTFAWFTDSVTSTNNIIKSGNLDVELEYSTDFAVWTPVTETTEIFKESTLWEPGYTEVVYLRVSNIGSLALKYNLGVNIAAETEGKNVDGDMFKLSDYIYFGTQNDVTAAYANRDAARTAVQANALQIKEGYTKPGTIEAGDPADVVALVVYMPETVGNEANYRDIQPVITLGINVLATQLNVEVDSFDKDYDIGASYFENVSTSVNVPDNATAPTTLTTEDVQVDVPAALLNELPAEVTSIALGYTTPKADTAAKTIVFDSIEFVDQNGDEIDVSTLPIAEMITVKLPVDGVFANGDQVVLYHDDEMVAIATVVDGFVTYEVAHFCEVTVVAAENVYDYIVDDLDGLIEAFANGGKVLLNADVQLEKLVSVLPGAEVYLNMNGKKLTVNQSTASNTLIYVQAGAKLVVDGNGTIDLDGVSTMAIFAPYGDLVIENGTFIRDEVTTITNKTTGLFMGAKVTTSNVVINGGYFDAGYYDENAADIEALLSGEAELEETADDIAKRNNSKDANVVRIALKENVAALLNHSGYGEFKVYGGTFVGANPAWGDEGCMLPTTPDYLRPWSYYQGALLDGQTFNANGIVLPDGYTITLGTTEANVPTYTVAYNK